MIDQEMTDAMKAEFIKAFQAKFGLGVMAATANDDAAAMMGAAAWAWQASREAVVIRLPKGVEPFGLLDPGEVEIEIENAGVKVKS